jgi:hypothetical protein
MHAQYLVVDDDCLVPVCESERIQVVVAEGGVVVEL